MQTRAPQPTERDITMQRILLRVCHGCAPRPLADRFPSSRERQNSVPTKIPEAKHGRQLAELGAIVTPKRYADLALAWQRCGTCYQTARLLRPPPKFANVLCNKLCSSMDWQPQSRSDNSCSQEMQGQCQSVNSNAYFFLNNLCTVQSVLGLFPVSSAARPNILCDPRALLVPVG